ncbi:hypothetical protein pipiens_011616 [Culex pipiens pipiens]|uniref:Uncharacterized protein n=1 Tax=Culex pipiens pipiens TaxID=38569 RepID=A0ABD1D6C5_CULPP
MSCGEIHAIAPVAGINPEDDKDAYGKMQVKVVEVAQKLYDNYEDHYSQMQIENDQDGIKVFLESLAKISGVDAENEKAIGDMLGDIRSSVRKNLLQLGSLSHYLNMTANGYQDLPGSEQDESEDSSSDSDSYSSYSEEDSSGGASSEADNNKSRAANKVAKATGKVPNVPNKAAEKNNLDLLLDLNDISPVGPIMTPSLDSQPNQKQHYTGLVNNRRGGCEWAKDALQIPMSVFTTPGEVDQEETPTQSKVCDITSADDSIT